MSQRCVRYAEATGLLLYFTMVMATNLQLHPYLSSTYLWIHEWQWSKIYTDLGKAENAHDMVQDATLKQVEDGYAIVSLLVHAETIVLCDPALLSSKRSGHCA